MGCRMGRRYYRAPQNTAAIPLHFVQVVLARDGVVELRADMFSKGSGSWYNAKLSSFYDDGPAM